MPRAPDGFKVRRRCGQGQGIAFLAARPQPGSPAAGQSRRRLRARSHQMYAHRYVEYVREGAMARASINVKRVTATDLREKLKTYLKKARANQVVLVENRRQSPKYLVDKEFLDSLVKERDAILATLEILADRELTDRLLALSKTIDHDVAAGRLLTTADVFGQ
jgi:coproporphyrinogen III oxidase-like Fe-S oxidoreductase